MKQEPSIPELQAENKKLHSEVGLLKGQLDALEEMVRHLQRKRFDPSCEPEPIHEDETVENDESIDVKPHALKSARKPLPKELPREEVLCDLTEEEKSCSCCGEQMAKTHEKLSEKLHVKPAEFIVKKYITPAYACKKCETMKQAKVPLHPIPKCSVTPETLGYIATSKFIDGMPFHRIEKAFGRHDIDIKRDQMSRWMVNLGGQLEKLKHLLHGQLLASDSIAMDETYIQVLKEKDRRPDQKSFLLVQAREGPRGQKIVLFHYHRSRAALVIGEYLEGFSGALVTDGLAVYGSYCQGRYINHGGCWAHARRRFVEALKGKKKRSGVAKVAMEIINELFAIEKELKGRPLPEVARIRRTQSQAHVEELRDLWVNNVDQIPKSSLTGKALHYLKNQWPLLTAFIEDPRLPIHNNYVERQIKHVATGRKSWLFCDTVAGANASAAFYSLMITAKENGLNPYDYICDVLRRLPTETDLESLLPFQSIH